MLLLQGSTQHRRFQPRSHHFQYPLIYAQIKVTKDAAVSQVHRLDAAGLLQIREVDYLPVQDHPGNLHERLLFLIQEKARVSLSSESAADWEIWLVTMPRWFGYAFNPVSVYFCWNEKKEWKWAVLEVGNTFGERLPYILSVNEASDSKRPNFHKRWIVQRQFHVSPFNDRRGWYEIHLKNPLSLPAEDSSSSAVNFLVIHHDWSSADVAPPMNTSVSYLNCDNFDQATKNQQTIKKLTAQLELIPSPNQSLSTVLFSYPFTLFLTFPRITWHAFLLAYRHGLSVYPRPMNLHADTLEQSPLDGYSTACRDLVFQHLQTVADSNPSVAFAIDHPVYGTAVISNAVDETDCSLPPVSPLDMTVFEICIASHEIWPWFHLLPDMATAIDLCVRMNWMTVGMRTTDKRPSMKQNAAIAELVNVLNVGIPVNRSLSLSQRVRAFVFPVNDRKWVPSRHPLSSYQSLLRSASLFIYLYIWVMMHFCIDAISRWQVGFEPAPWSVWRRYRANVLVTGQIKKSQ